MDWEKLDWTALDRLRDGFLQGTAAHGPYWRSLSDLEHYNVTYGERIGWKWDAVLRELKLRGWNPLIALGATPAPGTSMTAPTVKFSLADWGCGSGVAGRRVIDAWGADHVSQLLVRDHSSLAQEYAIAQARRQYPGLSVGELQPSSLFDVLVISHVLNELSPEARGELLLLARRAKAILWVEPGTHAVSRDLVSIREQLRSEFSVVAPCTHRERCGLLAAENAPHWCHYFAPPPPAIYADSDWVKFGQRAGIDLRSLPYSFLVLTKTMPGDVAAGSGAARVIGDPRHYKGFAKLLSCDESGVSDLTLQKRDEPALFKALKRGGGLPLYQWSRERDRIKQARPLFGYPTPDLNVDPAPESAAELD